MNRTWIRMLLAALVPATCVMGCASDPFEEASAARGGMLYDTWWKVGKVKNRDAPTITNPDYTKTNGTVMGSATWRCKECHGWDYRGRDGAYSKGSHVTGVVGILDAAQTPNEQLFDVMAIGLPDGTHNFSEHLSDRDIWDLVKFVKVGMTDATPYVDSTAKTAIGGDATHGAELYTGTCAECHQADGRKQNFGTPEEPEYVGTIAVDNPWEFLHKIRFGQPGSVMPSMVYDEDMTTQDLVDILAHAQTLPVE
jgi:mono/diheme cytochrome c family protein